MLTKRQYGDQIFVNDCKSITVADLQCRSSLRIFDFLENPQLLQ
jgi:hypothetical protein